ncbi:hypothetical protein BG003_000655 [Podila horticola]|nr:hypothetical protein BG003_000655 [Podila horticola]
MICPQCEQEQQPLELLDIAAFRPAKFIERVVNDHKIRCPTTIERSCQWTGYTDDIQNHLAENRDPSHLLRASAAKAVVKVSIATTRPYRPHMPP